jgi:hypothetical protein
LFIAALIVWTLQRNYLFNRESGVSGVSGVAGVAGITGVAGVTGVQEEKPAHTDESTVNFAGILCGAGSATPALCANARSGLPFCNS